MDSLRSGARRTCSTEVGEDWWRDPTTGDLLRKLFWEGTEPTSEGVAGQLGFNPLDLRPLVSELKGEAESLGVPAP